MAKLPVYFIPHGGGPWHVMKDAMGDPMGYGHLREYLENFGQQYSQKIKAILVISGHWEENIPTLQSGSNPSLFYDYYGFPDYTYHLNWSAGGNPPLAEHIENLLKASGFVTNRDYNRGYDHGTFVPLMVSFPEPDFPVIQLSLVNTLDPVTHIQMGKALEPLRNEGVLIVGSGMSYHSMRGFMTGGTSAIKNAEKFDKWLTETISNQDIETRNMGLINWYKAPSALECHPRSEHLVPLFVVTGAAANDEGKLDYSGTLMGLKISGYKFG